MGSQTNGFCGSEVGLAAGLAPGWVSGAGAGWRVLGGGVRLALAAVAGAALPGSVWCLA
jgi:hypothetical protein